MMAGPDVIITDLAHQRFAVFTNLKDGTFDYSTSALGLAPISLLHSGWGVRFMDYDNHGWKDLLIVQSHVMDTIEISEPSNDGPAWVLLNNTEASNHWITLKLVGVKSNRDAIGAQVRLLTSAGEQFSTVTTTGSYQSSSHKRLHFGFAGADFVREIEIRWPSGIRQLLTNQKVDAILTIAEPVESSGKANR